MDYYQRKAKASLRIKSLLDSKETVSLANILLVVEAEFGLSRKFVVERLTNLNKAGEILFDAEEGNITRLK